MKFLTPILLFATLTFAQYESDTYGFDQTASAANTPQTEYSVKSIDSENAKNDLYTHTHRGFYFSTSLTFAYMSSTHNEKYGHYEKDETKASGLLYPYEEVRLGGSIAGVASIYGLIGAGVGSGTFERKSTEADESFKTDDATLLKLQFGLGGEFYPIQEKENPMHGLFVGFAFGLAIDGAFYKRARNSYYDDEDDYYSGDDGYPYLFYRFEIGKDFWFSKRWSVGVAFNYTYGTYNDENSGYEEDHETDECTGHTFGLTIRLSH